MTGSLDTVKIMAETILFKMLPCFQHSGHSPVLLMRIMWRSHHMLGVTCSSPLFPTEYPKFLRCHTMSHRIILLQLRPLVLTIMCRSSSDTAVTKEAWQENQAWQKLPDRCASLFLFILACGGGVGGIMPLPADQINGLILDIILTLWKAWRPGK